MGSFLREFFKGSGGGVRWLTEGNYKVGNESGEKSNLKKILRVWRLTGVEA